MKTKQQSLFNEVFHGDMVNLSAKSFEAKLPKSVGGEKYLTEADMKQFSAACRRIFDLMKDQQWHSMEQIQKAATEPGKRPPSEYMRRLRDLRKLRNWTLECKKISLCSTPTRNFVYRLVRN